MSTNTDVIERLNKSLQAKRLEEKNKSTTTGSKSKPKQRHVLRFSSLQEEVWYKVLEFKGVKKGDFGEFPVVLKNVQSKIPCEPTEVYLPKTFDTEKLKEMLENGKAYIISHGKKVNEDGYSPYEYD